MLSLLVVDGGENGALDSVNYTIGECLLSCDTIPLRSCEKFAENVSIACEVQSITA